MMRCNRQEKTAVIRQFERGETWETQGQTQTINKEVGKAACLTL